MGGDNGRNAFKHLLECFALERLVALFMGACHAILWYLECSMAGCAFYTHIPTDMVSYITSSNLLHLLHAVPAPHSDRRDEYD